MRATAARARESARERRAAAAPRAARLTSAPPTRRTPGSPRPTRRTPDGRAQPAAGLSLPGGYRRLLARPRQLEHQVFRYSDPTLPLAPTDLTSLRGVAEPAGDQGGAWVALRL
eukprot:5230078-Prymnesium_polylepis.1